MARPGLRTARSGPIPPPAPVVSGTHLLGAPGGWGGTHKVLCASQHSCDQKRGSRRPREICARATSLVTSRPKRTCPVLPPVSPAVTVLPSCHAADSTDEQMEPWRGSGLAPEKNDAPDVTVGVVGRTLRTPTGLPRVHKGWWCRSHPSPSPITSDPVEGGVRVAPSGLSDLAWVMSGALGSSASRHPICLLLSRVRCRAGLDARVPPFPFQVGSPLQGPPTIRGPAKSYNPVLLCPWSVGSGSEPDTNTNTERGNLGRPPTWGQLCSDSAGDRWGQMGRGLVKENHLL